MTAAPVSPLAAPTFDEVLARLDAVIRYPLVSPVFLFWLADALREWSDAEAAAGLLVCATELSLRAVAAGDAATAASRELSGISTKIVADNHRRRADALRGFLTMTIKDPE